MPLVGPRVIGKATSAARLPAHPERRHLEWLRVSLGDRVRAIPIAALWS